MYMLVIPCLRAKPLPTKVSTPLSNYTPRCRN